MMIAAEPFFRLFRRTSFTLVVVLACLGHRSSFGLEPVDFSDMTAFPTNTKEWQHFLVVNDQKYTASSNQSRVGVLTIESRKENDKLIQNQSYVDVTIPDAEWGDRLASDLEGVCCISESEDRYLLMESGYYKTPCGEIVCGQLFVMQLTMNGDGTYRGSIERKYQIPRTEPFVNLEGIACFKWQDRLHVLFADRTSPLKPAGEAAAESHATIYIAALPEKGGDITWAELTQVTAPGFKGRKDKNLRHITALHLQADATAPDKQILWASGAFDQGNLGPFYSEVYQVGILDPKASSQPELFKPTPQDRATWTCEGIKVEAIAACQTSESKICVGTDDELLRSIWRQLERK